MAKDVLALYLSSANGKHVRFKHVMNSEYLCQTWAWFHMELVSFRFTYIILTYNLVYNREESVLFR